MSHRSTSIISALGLSAVLLGASPASATSQRIEVDKTVDGTSVVVSPRMAERGYEVRRTTLRTDKTERPIVSARMAERGYEVRRTTLRTDKTERPIVSARMAERGYEVRTTPVEDDCSLRSPCRARARDATTPAGDS